MKPARTVPLFGLLIAGASAAAVLALMAGSAAVTPQEVWTALTGGDAGARGDIVLNLRLPRALAAFGVGALLALAGALMQVLLRNPLAEPYLMGISGGAAVGALSMLLIGASLLLVHVAAAVGAAATVLLVLGLARHDFAQGAGHDGSPRLLLTGVIIAAGCGAIVTLILSIAPDNKLRGMLFWLMGDFNGVDRWQPALGGAVLALLLMLPEARSLNAPVARRAGGADPWGQRACAAFSALRGRVHRHRARGHDGGYGRLYRPDHSACGAADHRQRSAHPIARFSVGWRHAAGTCRHAGAHGGGTGAVAGGRGDGVDWGAGLSLFVAATP